MTDWKKMAAYYRDQYGDETDHLFLALSMPQKKVALLNPFLTKEKIFDVIGEPESSTTICDMTFYYLPTDAAPKMVDGLLSHYFLDLSSVLPALLLPITPHSRVLDMCSAPGGKLLVMISRMIEDVFFVGNDISSARTLRLKRVMTSYLPKDFQTAHVKITTRDGSFFGLKQRDFYDAILLDAPCSSEGHVVNDETLLKKFSGLKKSLPMRQYSLLSAALLALKPGGFLMYSTCTINKNENDAVIKKLLHKKKDICVLKAFSSPFGEASEFGVSVLPHRHHAGPSFLSLLCRH